METVLQWNVTPSKPDLDLGRNNGMNLNSSRKPTNWFETCLHITSNTTPQTASTTIHQAYSLKQKLSNIIPQTLSLKHYPSNIIPQTLSLKHKKKKLKHCNVRSATILAADLWDEEEEAQQVLGRHGAAQIATNVADFQHHLKKNTKVLVLECTTKLVIFHGSSWWWIPSFLQSFFPVFCSVNNMMMCFDLAFWVNKYFMLIAWKQTTWLERVMMMVWMITW